MSDPIALLSQQLRPLVVDCDDGFRELREAIPGHAERRLPRRPGRRAVIVGAVVGLFGLGVGGVAVATGGAHTGVFGLPGATENDTSEYLDTNAADFREVALGYAKGVDFAPGYSAEMYLGLLSPAHQVPQLPPELQGRGVIMQVTGVQGSIENWAFCSWAHVSTTDATALAKMRAIANTKAMAATNQKNYNLNLVGQAEQGDPGPLQQYLRMACPQPTPWPAP